MPSVPPPQVDSPDPVPLPAPETPDHSEEVPWPIWTVPAAFALGLVVGVLSTAVVAGISKATGSGTDTPAVNIVGDIVFDLSFVGVALWLAVANGHPRPSDFGYRRVALGLGIGAFLIAGVSYYVVTAVYQAIFSLHGTDKLPKGLGVGQSTAALVGAAVFVCVVAPVAEEFFFRGFMFGALRRWHFSVGGHDLGTWAAAVVTGTLFGLVHTGSASPQYLIPLGFFGFVLCLVRWRTGSLYPCMALHSVNNSLALGITQLHWTAGEVLALAAGSVALIGALTLPLANPIDAVARRDLLPAMLGVLAGRVTAAAALVAAIAAVFAASASAASSPAAPAHGTLRLSVPDAFAVGGRLVTVPGRVIHVQGVVRPYVPGQTVLVTAFVGSRQFKTARVSILPAAGGRYGRFSETISSPSAGQVTVRAGHTRTAALGGVLARRTLAALDPHAGFGSSGPFVELIQQRLAALHFYIPQTGVYDSGTGLALDAYHRLLHWGTYQTLDGRTISYLLDGFGEFKVRFPTHGRHAEGNLSLQLLALVDGSHVYRIYPISSGKPSTPTILGDFHVYSKVPGYLPDGMYFSNFFISGYAIHGYNPAPDYPASHGCMRVPIVDATSIYGWLQIGNWVDVYH